MYVPDPLAGKPPSRLLGPISTVAVLRSLQFTIKSASPVLYEGRPTQPTQINGDDRYYAGSIG